MNTKMLLALYAVGWFLWMAVFLALDANGVMRHGDIWWAIAGATLWPVALPALVVMFLF